MHWFKDNRGKVILTLVALWIGVLVAQFRVYYVITPVVGVSATIIFDGLISLLRKRTWVVTESSWVTGLLIGLIVDPTGIWAAVVASLIASLTKQFIAPGDHRHVFNPAAMGIFVSSLILQRPVAWWGAAWGIVPAVIIAVGMLSTLITLRRVWTAVLFLLLYFGFTRSIALTVDGTVFLFAFIMLVDPITSISGKWWKYLWGVLVGLLAGLASMLRLNLDPLLTALLITNAGTYIALKRYRTW